MIRPHVRENKLNKSNKVNQLWVPRFSIQLALIDQLLEVLCMLLIWEIRS